MMPNRLAKELALRSGIGVRYGCHCAHILIKHILNIPPFLERFQSLIQTVFPKLRLPGLVRVSLGIENSEEDVDRLIHELNKIASHGQSPADSHSASKSKVTSILPPATVKQQMKDFVRSSSQRVYS